MISLYVHIPFCLRKCFYCSYSVAVNQDHLIGAYVSSLAKEIQANKNAAIKTVYFGGGTPSRIPFSQLERIVKAIRSAFDCGQVSEWTVEVNPEDVTMGFIQALLGLGVTRISAGVQTFDRRRLQEIGRCHTPERVYEAYHCLRSAGCRNISLDMMYGFPGQTHRDIADDVRELAAMSPEHVSLYNLSVEPRSCFFVRGVRPRSAAEQGAQYSYVADLLQDEGYVQYEVSNFCRPGYASRHNRHYWRGGNYFGIGAAAHSHMDGHRWWNTDRLREYIKRGETGEDPRTGEERLDPQQRLSEALVFGLRMLEGVNIKALEQKYQSALREEQKRSLDDLLDKQFLLEEGGCIRVSRKGLLRLDMLSIELI
ncbi:MAG: radical SAM family heme chaperone HemW [Candidatus Omnitrophota bacterium]